MWRGIHHTRSSESVSIILEEAVWIYSNVGYLLMLDTFKIKTLPNRIQHKDSCCLRSLMLCKENPIILEMVNKIQMFLGQLRIIIPKVILTAYVIVVVRTTLFIECIVTSK